MVVKSELVLIAVIAIALVAIVTQSETNPVGLVTRGTLSAGSTVIEEEQNTCIINEGGCHYTVSAETVDGPDGALGSAQLAAMQKCEELRTNYVSSGGLADRCQQHMDEERDFCIRRNCQYYGTLPGYGPCEIAECHFETTYDDDGTKHEAWNCYASFSLSSTATCTPII